MQNMVAKLSPTGEHMVLLNIETTTLNPTKEWIIINALLVVIYCHNCHFFITLDTESENNLN